MRNRRHDAVMLKLKLPASTRCSMPAVTDHGAVVIDSAALRTSSRTLNGGE